MTHVLISFKENPYFTFYLKSRGRYYKPLKKKNWVGLDKNGNELSELNSKEAAYVLIKCCSNEEFKQAIFFERVVYRVVNDDELVDTEQLRLELSEALSRNALSKFLDPLCMFLRLYHSLNHTAKSLLPFIVIKFLASNYLFDFIKNATSSINSLDTEDDGLTTSCVNSAYAVAVIFYGETLANKCIRVLTRGHLTPIKVPLQSKSEWQCTVKDLFSGDITQEIVHDADFDIEDPDKKLSIYCAPHKQRFYEYCQPLIDKCTSLDSDEKSIAALEKTFSEINYDFNANVLDTFIREIGENESKIRANNSFIYFVIISMPCSDLADRPDMEHVFVIEQFYLNAKEVGYRIYQSWIYKATLNEDMIRRDYGEFGENAMTYREIYTFLRAIQKLYSSSRDLRTVSTEKCFGYTSPADQLPLTRFEQNILAGTNLRYFSGQVNPKNCLKNFYSFFSGEKSIFKQEQQDDCLSRPVIR